MPEVAQAYDETRVFMEGVRVEFDPKAVVFRTVSITVDGRVLRGILTTAAAEQSLQSLQRAVGKWYSFRGDQRVICGQFEEA